MHSLPIHQSTLGMSFHADSAVLPRYGLKRQAALFGRFLQSHSLGNLDATALYFIHIYPLSPEVHSSPALVNFYTNQFLLFKAFRYPCQKKFFLSHHGALCFAILAPFRKALWVLFPIGNSIPDLRLDQKAFSLHENPNHDPVDGKIIPYTSTSAGVEIASEPRKYSEPALPSPGQLRPCTPLCPV